MSTDTGHEGSDGTAALVVQVDVAALYARYATKLDDGARSVLTENNMSSEVDDAVQTVVLNLLGMHQRGVLTPKEDWAPYLWRAARNAALDIVTKRGRADSLDRHLEDGLGDRLSERTEGHDPVADEATLRYDAHNLWRAMDQLGLDERGRRIVTGYYLDGMTDADLGRELDISGQRVGVIRRGVQARLAEMLQGGDHA